MFVLYIIAGMVGSGAIGLLIFYHSKPLKMTSSTLGRVVASEEIERRDETRRWDETHVTCQYVVAGREYTVQAILRGRQARRFPVGREVEVRYNPALPDMSRIPV